jgi:hypothetical protein
MRGAHIENCLRNGLRHREVLRLIKMWQQAPRSTITIGPPQ